MKDTHDTYIHRGGVTRRHTAGTLMPYVYNTYTLNISKLLNHSLLPVNLDINNPQRPTPTPNTPKPRPTAQPERDH
jgi:hypothetical protein